MSDENEVDLADDIRQIFSTALYFSSHRQAIEYIEPAVSAALVSRGYRPLLGPGLDDEASQVKASQVNVRPSPHLDETRVASCCRHSRCKSCGRFRWCGGHASSIETCHVEDDDECQLAAMLAAASKAARNKVNETLSLRRAMKDWIRRAWRAEAEVERLREIEDLLRRVGVGKKRWKERDAACRLSGTHESSGIDVDGFIRDSDPLYDDMVRAREQLSAIEAALAAGDPRPFVIDERLGRRSGDG